SALGREQDYSQLGREIASSYLLLGGLRVSGIAANALGSGIRIRPIQGVIQQAGMLGGILLGHGLEESFQLRAHQAGATTLVDSLALLLQFNVAGNLTRHAFGEGFHAWEQGLEWRNRQLTEPSSHTPPFLFPNFVGESLGISTSLRQVPVSAVPHLMMAVPHQTFGGVSEPTTVIEKIRQELAARSQDLQESARREITGPEIAAALQEEARILDQLEKGSVLEFFSSLNPLRRFYLKNLRHGGLQGIRWLSRLEGEVSQFTRQRRLY